jgi:hypothetical protein
LELRVGNLISETGKYLSMWKDKRNKCKHEQRDPGRPRKMWNSTFVFNEVSKPLEEEKGMFFCYKLHLHVLFVWFRNTTGNAK